MLEHRHIEPVSGELYRGHQAGVPCADYEHVHRRALPNRCRKKHGRVRLAGDGLARPAPQAEWTGVVAAATLAERFAGSILTV